MSTEREASSNINATSTTTGGANVPARTSRGSAVQQGFNTQQYQGGGSQSSSQPAATEGIIHIAGGSSSRPGGGRGATATFQQYGHGIVQQQGPTMLINSASAVANSMQINTATPCAACKLLRRRCAQECPFAPYFSPHDPQRFASVHKIYGASNVSKMLMEVPEIHRADTANSLVYEANARLRDPVYGCMGVVSMLQQQAQALQAELNAIRGEVMRYKTCHVEVALQQQQQQPPPLYSTPPPPSTIAPHDLQQNRGHPLSVIPDHYLKTSGPTNVSTSTSIVDQDSKSCLMPWP